MFQCIEMKDFRNFQTIKVEFSPTVNIIYGENGSGKSNLLEALYLCSFGKSFRGSKQPFVRFDCEFARIKTRNPDRESVEIIIRQNGRKQILLNTKRIPQYTKLLGHFPTTYIGPNEIMLVSGSPSVRRSMLDSHLCQFDPEYVQALIDYNNTVKRRNASLKGIAEKTLVGGMVLIETLDEQIAKLGCIINRGRLKFLKEIEINVKDYFENIFGPNAPELGLEYESTVCNDPMSEDYKKYFIKKLKYSRKKDLILTQTTIGPHRDDLKITLNDLPARTYASWGQARMISLAVYLAATKLTGDKARRIPTVLLDDALAELDNERAIRAIDIVPSVGQVTVVTPHHNISTTYSNTKRFKFLEKGVIQEI